MSAPSTMTPDEAELHERIVDLFTRDVTPDDRDTILRAYDAAPTWAALPPDVRDLIERLEGELEQQTWSDPSEVPDWVYEQAAAQGQPDLPPYVVPLDQAAPHDTSSED